MREGKQASVSVLTASGETGHVIRGHMCQAKAHNRKLWVGSHHNRIMPLYGQCEYWEVDLERTTVKKPEWRGHSLLNQCAGIVKAFGITVASLSLSHTNAGIAGSTCLDNAQLGSIVDATLDVWNKIWQADFYEQDETRKVIGVASSWVVLPFYGLSALLDA